MAFRNLFYNCLEDLLPHHINSKLCNNSPAQPSFQTVYTCYEVSPISLTDGQRSNATLIDTLFFADASHVVVYENRMYSNMTQHQFFLKTWYPS